MQRTRDGRGVINVLAADTLIRSPRVYSTFLLWLLSELFEELPEIGDPDKPELVFFFDEAHLLFKDAPKALLQTIEQVVRLIRSKGVGVYFVTQSPADIPDSVLGQLGNRVQHALRAYTPKERKAVRVAAQSFPREPALDTAAVISELGVGEALVSTLQARRTIGRAAHADLTHPPRAWARPRRRAPGRAGERSEPARYARAWTARVRTSNCSRAAAGSSRRAGRGGLARASAAPASAVDGSARSQSTTRGLRQEHGAQPGFRAGTLPRQKAVPRHPGLPAALGGPAQEPGSHARRHLAGARPLTTGPAPAAPPRGPGRRRNSCGRSSAIAPPRGMACAACTVRCAEARCSACRP
jgi:hypothetical protein